MLLTANRCWRGWKKNKGDFDVEIIDETLDTVMIAIQGPESAAIMKSHSPDDLAALTYFTFI